MHSELLQGLHCLIELVVVLLVIRLVRRQLILHELGGGAQGCAVGVLQLQGVSRVGGVAVGGGGRVVGICGRMFLQKESKNEYKRVI